MAAQLQQSEGREHNRQLSQVAEIKTNKQTKGESWGSKLLSRMLILFSFCLPACGVSLRLKQPKNSRLLSFPHDITEFGSNLFVYLLYKKVDIQKVWADCYIFTIHYNIGLSK